MEKKTVTVQQKKRIILIATCLIAFIIIILFIFKLVVHKNTSHTTDVEDTKKLSGVFVVPGTTQTSNHTISNQKCVGKICIREIKIQYQGKRGLISYVIENTNTSSKSGKLRVVLNGKKFVFPYSVGAGATKTYYYGYDDYNFDFNNFGDYTVENAGTGDNGTLYANMSDEEKAAIQVN